MDFIEIIIFLIFLLGLGYLLFLILRDPILMIKTFLRGMKSNHRLAIISFPIWIPMWLIDKAFDLKIFIKNFEEASVKSKIDFKNFNQYLIVNGAVKSDLMKIINDFRTEKDVDDILNKINSIDISITESFNKIILKIRNNDSFYAFKMLINIIDNVAPQNKIYNVTGILLDKSDISKSFYLQKNSTDLKLYGKTYMNKKIYANIDETEDIDLIYFNTNIELIKRFNFDKFKNNTSELNYTKC